MAQCDVLSKVILAIFFFFSEVAQKYWAKSRRKEIWNQYQFERLQERVVFV